MGDQVVLQRPKRLVGRQVILLTVAALITVVSVGTVGANNTMGHVMPDGTPTYIFRNNLTVLFSDAADYVRLNSMNPTDLTTLYVSNVNDAYLNVVDNDCGNTGWAGMWSCASWGAMNICNRGDVIMNQNGCCVPGGSYSTTEARSVMCEELGHGVRLDHNADGATNVGSCMATPVNWNNYFWNTHDDGHVSFAY